MVSRSNRYKKSRRFLSSFVFTANQYIYLNLPLDTMKNFASLKLLVASAITFASAARIVDPYKFAEGHDLSEGYDIHWQQTKEPHTGEYHGGLGSSVNGMFPKMSDSKIGVGCGVNWGNGLVNAGFDGGDGRNGVGGGFSWMPHALSSVVGVQYKDTILNLNLTITEWNQVLFSVNDVELDWNQVVMAVKDPEHGYYAQKLATGKDAGEAKYANRKPSAADKSAAFDKDNAI